MTKTALAMRAAAARRKAALEALLRKYSVAEVRRLLSRQSVLDAAARVL